MKRKDKTHVFIGIPTETNTVHVPVAAFAVEAMKQNTKRGCPFKFSVAYLVGKSPTEYARNCLATMAIDNPKVDALWFVDSDMGPSPDSFNLLNVDADIVAGIAPIFSNADVNQPSFTYNLYRRVEDLNGRDFFPVAPNGATGPIEVDGVGTACMIIKRKVLEDKRLWLGERHEGIIPLFRWPRASTGQTTSTDDLDFCRRAKELGYTIKAHPHVIWSHFKEVDLLWIVKKLNTILQSPPQHMSTINEWNNLGLLNGHTPKFVYPTHPKPSTEAVPAIPQAALIAPTVAG